MASNDYTDESKQHRLNRRSLVSSISGTGAGAVAGCADVGERTGPATQGTGGTDPGGVGATATDGQGRHLGDVVYYDPDGDGGPYADGQEALDAVPSGGTFVIGNGTWDVAEEGRLVIDKTVNVRGMGWASNREEQQGTQIVNTGGDTLNEPTVEFNGDRLQTDQKNPRILGSLRNVMVRHHGDAPAVLVRRAIKTTIADCHISCDGKAPKGLKYETWGFFSRAVRNTVVGATEICAQVTGVGYAHEFYSNHFATGADDATAFQTQRQRTILVGGECAVTGENGTAVEFYNPGDDGIQAGGYVVEPGIEHTAKSIVIDGDAPFNDVQVYHLKSSFEGDKPMITFGATKNSKVFYPVLKDHHEGTLARWSELSSDCGIVTDTKVLKNLSVNDEGARNPYIRVTSSADDEDLQKLPTGVPTTVAFNPDAGAPIFHDGQRWKRVGSEEYPPGN
jgi:hypothetical protein